MTWEAAARAPSSFIGDGRNSPEADTTASSSLQRFQREISGSSLGNPLGSASQMAGLAGSPSRQHSGVVERRFGVRQLGCVLRESRGECSTTVRVDGRATGG